MNNQPSQKSHSNLDLASLLIGFSCGIAATFVYATFKEREFDGLANKARRLTGSVGDFAEHLSDDTHQMSSNLIGAAQDGIRSVKESSNEAVKSVRKVLTDA